MNHPNRLRICGRHLDIQKGLFFHLIQDAPYDSEDDPRNPTQGYGAGQNGDPETRLVGMVKTDPHKDKGDKA